MGQPYLAVGVRVGAAHHRSLVLEDLRRKRCSQQVPASGSLLQAAVVSPERQESIPQESGASYPPGNTQEGMRYRQGTHMRLGWSQSQVLPPYPALAPRLHPRSPGQGEKGSPHQPRTCTQG